MHTILDIEFKGSLYTRGFRIYVFIYVNNKFLTSCYQMSLLNSLCMSKCKCYVTSVLLSAPI